MLSTTLLVYWSGTMGERVLQGQIVHWYTNVLHCQELAEDSHVLHAVEQVISATLQHMLVS